MFSAAIISPARYWSNPAFHRDDTLERLGCPAGKTRAMVPKYLRPVFDRNAYGPLSKTEKAVRFVIFVPIIFALQLPAILLLLAFGFSMGMGPVRILLDDSGAATWLKIIMFVFTPIMYLIGMWVRKYFLPFD
ncbi:hypothetical protein ACWF50_12115 [Brucella pseudogrignonensis]